MLKVENKLPYHLPVPSYDFWRPDAKCTLGALIALNLESKKMSTSGKKIFFHQKTPMPLTKKSAAKKVKRPFRLLFI